MATRSQAVIAPSSAAATVVCLKRVSRVVGFPHIHYRPTPYSRTQPAPSCCLGREANSILMTVMPTSRSGLLLGR